LIDFKSLKREFKPKDLDFRVLRQGLRMQKPWAMVAVYVDARAVMDRLDQVAGPDNWKDDYFVHDDKTVTCHLSLRINNEWITKSDVGVPSNTEPMKGAFSDALKRAAVKWGVGRYLYEYKDLFAHFVEGRTPNSKTTKIEGKYYNWEPPMGRLNPKNRVDKFEADLEKRVDNIKDDLDPDHPDSTSILDDLPGPVKGRNGSGSVIDQLEDFKQKVPPAGDIVGPTRPIDDPQTPQKNDTLPNHAPVSKPDLQNMVKVCKDHGWSAEDFTALMQKALNKEKFSELKKAEVDFLKSIVVERQPLEVLIDA
jgi:hypothetical protein